MKFFLALCIFLSLGVVGYVGYKLFNSYASLKYEVEEPLAMGKVSNETINLKETYIQNVIFWLWFIIVIEVINVLLFSYLLLKHKE